MKGRKERGGSKERKKGRVYQGKRTDPEVEQEREERLIVKVEKVRSSLKLFNVSAS